MLNRLFAYKSPCAIERLDLCRRAGFNRKPGCLRYISQLLSAALLVGVGEYAALTPTSVATRVGAAEGEDLPAQHSEAGSELGLCLRSSDSSMAMKQLK